VGYRRASPSALTAKITPPSQWRIWYRRIHPETGCLLQSNDLQNLRHTTSLHLWLRPGKAVDEAFLKIAASWG
jgi:hypothetical protein